MAKLKIRKYAYLRIFSNSVGDRCCKVGYSDCCHVVISKCICGGDGASGGGWVVVVVVLVVWYS